MRALLIEDEFGARITLTRVLEKLMDVDLAMNGTEALGAFNMAVDMDNPYDLLLVDVGLPMMDGVELVNRIRAVETKNKLPPARVIMITAYDEEEIKKKDPEFTYDAYIKKPVEKAKILEIISDI